MFKNTASQKLTVLAFADAGHASLDAGEIVTGDAANITMKVEQDDDGVRTASNDVNPAETEDGQYVFDLTQAEVNGDKITFYPQSSTGGVQVVALPSSVIYTRPPNFGDLGIESDGDLAKVNDLNGNTPQTADHTAAIADVPTVAEFNARTLLAASYFDPAADTVVTVTTVSNQVTADVTAISGDATAADNLELMYDGTGYVDPTAPSSRSQVDAIGAASGGSVNIEATEDNVGGAIDPSSALFVGLVQGGTTFANTESEDGVYHDIDDDSADIDIVYGFDIGGSRIATEVSFAGFVQGISDEMKVKAYDHVGTTWDIIGTIDGQNGTANISLSLALLLKHTGTGAELGKVYIRIETDSTTPSNLSVDKLLVSAVSNSSTLGFVGGAVWVDTVNGTSGTGEGVGTISVPSDNIADAKTIADNNNLRVFHLLPQSSVTLAASYDGYEFVGFGYIVILNGQSVSGASFSYAVIQGNDSGANAVRTTYISCDIDGSTLGIHNALSCRLSGDMILAEAGDYFWDQCFSAIAGTGSPSVDFQAAAETKALSVRHYSGGMEFKNFGNLGTHTASVEGNGQVIANANCAGGTIAVRGNFDRTDNSGGAVTWSDDARLTRSEIRDEIMPTQNAPFNNIEFVYRAASDHVTPVTGATGMAVTRSIDGGAFGAGTGTGPAEVSNGVYQYDASAADMNGGVITFRFTASGGTPGAADDTFLTIVTGGGV